MMERGAPPAEAAREDGDRGGAGGFALRTAGADGGWGCPWGGSPGRGWSGSMAFRYRFYPDVSQLPGCGRHSADARFVWNLALEQANWWRPGRGPAPGSAERHCQLAEARAGSWLGTGSSSVQQQALRDFDRAMRNWWAGTHGRPRWRKAGVDEGFCIRDVKVRRISRKWAEVHVPKVGWVRFRLTRPLGEHGMARVTRDRAGRWHVSFSAPQPPVVRTATGAAIGVDLGVAPTVTTTPGEHL